MASSVEQVLKDIGPGISSRITAKLMEGGMTAAAARQQISRAKGDVKRLFTFNLPKREKFLYLESQFSSPEYWEALARDLDTTRSVYGAALHSLLARGGIAPKASFDILSGAPMNQKGQLSSSVVLQKMQAAHLVSVRHIEGIGECVAVDGNTHYESVGGADLRARLITENILLLAVRDWVRRLAMVSYNKVAYRDPSSGEGPKFSTCHWDLCGPSYLRPFVRLNVGGKAMIEKWLKKVDVIHAVLKVDKRFKTAKFGFEYWTCGTFSVFSNRWKSVRHATSNTSKPEGFPALVTTILVIDM